MRKPIEFVGFPRAILDDPRWREALWRWMGVLKEHTDGDTCHYYVDGGYRRYAFEAMRFVGFDTWEKFQGTATDRAKGKMADDYMRALLPVGTHCGLVTEKEEESLSRWVAKVLVVFTEDMLGVVRTHCVTTPWWLRCPEPMQEERVGMVVDVAWLFQGTEHEKGAPLGGYPQPLVR